MVNSIRNRHIRRSLLAVITLLTTTACSTTKLVKDERGINIDRVDSKAAVVSRAYLTQTGDQLTVRGEVKRRYLSRGPIPGHLHITLIDPQGQTVKEADIRYMRRSAHSSTATFSAKLPTELQPGSLIKITHFDTKNHDNPSHDGIWRDIE
ncbi:MAG: hypothetical protein AB1810_14450 [Pseudomonadota bacterium]